MSISSTSSAQGRHRPGRTAKIRHFGPQHPSLTLCQRAVIADTYSYSPGFARGVQPAPNCPRVLHRVRARRPRANFSFRQNIGEIGCDLDQFAEYLGCADPHTNCRSFKRLRTTAECIGHSCSRRSAGPDDSAFDHSASRYLFVSQS